jgi:hypothetical protein
MRFMLCASVVPQAGAQDERPELVGEVIGEIVEFAGRGSDCSTGGGSERSMLDDA